MSGSEKRDKMVGFKLQWLEMAELRNAYNDLMGIFGLLQEEAYNLTKVFSLLQEEAKN